MISSSISVSLGVILWHAYYDFIETWVFSHLLYPQQLSPIIVLPSCARTEEDDGDVSRQVWGYKDLSFVAATKFIVLSDWPNQRTATEDSAHRSKLYSQGGA